MATKTFTANYAPNAQANGIAITWTGLQNGDNGAPYEGVDFADRAVMISGTFGAAGSINIEGSNDAATWFVLTDPQGNNITKTANALETIEENPRFLRPNVTAGDGTTSLTVVLWARRNR